LTERYNVVNLSEKFKKTLKNPAKKLTGAKRRELEAQTTLDYFQGNARKAEKELGWGRETIKKGMKEIECGIVCVEMERHEEYKQKRQVIII
jgi:DNA-binding protein Fis